MSLAEVLQVACQNFDVYSFILKGKKKRMAVAQSPAPVLQTGWRVCGKSGITCHRGWSLPEVLTGKGRVWHMPRRPLSSGPGRGVLLGCDFWGGLQAPAYRSKRVRRKKKLSPARSWASMQPPNFWGGNLGSGEGSPSSVEKKEGKKGCLLIAPQTSATHHLPKMWNPWGKTLGHSGELGSFAN